MCTGLRKHSGHFNWVFHMFTAGKKGLLMRSFSGICAVWRVGLPPTLIQFHYRVGIRYVYLLSSWPMYLQIMKLLCLIHYNVDGMQEVLLPGGHGLMVRGYRPVINTLAKGLDIRLNHKYASLSFSY
jgi:hypothetical protein